MRYNSRRPNTPSNRRNRGYARYYLETYLDAIEDGVEPCVTTIRAERLLGLSEHDEITAEARKGIRFIEVDLADIRGTEILERAWRVAKSLDDYSGAIKMRDAWREYIEIIEIAGGVADCYWNAWDYWNDRATASKPKKARKRARKSTK